MFVGFFCFLFCFCFLFVIELVFSSLCAWKKINCESIPIQLNYSQLPVCTVFGDFLKLGTSKHGLNMLST